MQIVSSWDNLHEMPKPIFWEKQVKKYFKMSSDEILPSRQSVEICLFVGLLRRDPVYSLLYWIRRMPCWGPWLSKKRPAKTLIRLRGAVWFESSLGIDFRKYIFSNFGLYVAFLTSPIWNYFFFRYKAYLKCIGIDICINYERVNIWFLEMSLEILFSLLLFQKYKK